MEKYSYQINIRKRNKIVFNFLLQFTENQYQYRELFRNKTHFHMSDQTF